MQIVLNAFVALPDIAFWAFIALDSKGDGFEAIILMSTAFDNIVYYIVALFYNYMIQATLSNMLSIENQIKG